MFIFITLLIMKVTVGMRSRICLKARLTAVTTFDVLLSDDINAILSTGCLNNLDSNVNGGILIISTVPLLRMKLSLI